MGRNRPMPNRILIIDDNSDLRDSLDDLLSGLGCRVGTAKDGYEGIEKASEQKWDIILLDVKMPGIDGIETARRIKSNRIESFIVLMTAFSIEELAERALKAGVDGVIIKPFDAEELIDQLEKRSRAHEFFTALEKMWKHMAAELGQKKTRFLFEGVLKKGISGDEIATFLERTGDGIFVNRFGENGVNDCTFLNDLERLLRESRGKTDTHRGKAR